MVSSHREVKDLTIKPRETYGVPVRNAWRTRGERHVRTGACRSTSTHDVLADPFAIYPAIRDAGVAVQLVRPSSVPTSSDGRASSSRWSHDPPGQRRMSGEADLHASAHEVRDNDPVHEASDEAHGDERGQIRSRDYLQALRSRLEAAGSASQESLAAMEVVALIARLAARLNQDFDQVHACLLYTSPSPRD